MQHNSRIEALSRDWLRLAGLTICACQASVALVVVGRWMAGAFTRGLAPLQACVVATFTTALGAAAYLALRRSRTLAHSWAALMVAFAPALLPMVVLTPSGSIAAVAYATVLVAACAGVVFVAEFGPSPRDDDLQRSIARLPAGDLARGEDRPAVVQWMSRRQEAGAETIEGHMQVVFAAGERQQVLHLSFCPPLPGVPTLECEVLDEALVELRVAAAHAYGARIEVRRDGESTHPLTSEIGFAATAPIVDRAAA